MESKSEKPKQTGQIISGILISLFTLILILALLEVGTRLLTRNIPKHVGEIRGADAPAYQGAPYINTQFLMEIPESNRLYRVEGVNLILNKDYDGEYINIVDGIRATSDQPENYEHTLYIFGGSSVFGSEVPDEYTLASYLQRQLNEHYGDTYRVVNMGIIDMSIEQQLNRLKITELNPGDVVLFYDGFNDATIMYSEAYDPDTIPWDSQRQTTRLGRMFRGFVNTLTRHSAFAYYVLGFHNFEPRFLDDEAQIEQIQTNLKGYILPLYMEADAYAAENDALFVQILQPCIFNLPEYTDQEQFIVNARPLVPKGWPESVQLGYEAFREMGAALNAAGIPSFDLSHALNPEHRPTPETEIFLDYVHINHIGNETIAENIFEHLHPILSPENQP
jgi:lysophospholipase L1-like esterase